MRFFKVCVMITAVELYIFLRISVTLSEFHSYSGIKYSELQSFFFVVFFFFLSLSFSLTAGSCAITFKPFVNVIHVINKALCTSVKRILKKKKVDVGFTA